MLGLLPTLSKLQSHPTFLCDLPRHSVVRRRHALQFSRAYTFGLVPRQFACRAAGNSQGPDQLTQTTKPEENTKDRLKQTLADLDALLGIEEEVKDDANKKGERPSLDVSLSPAALRQLAEAEAARSANGSPEAMTQDLSDQMAKIVEQAKRLADEKNGESTAGEGALRKEFETLLEMLKTDSGIDKEDVKKLKEQVFNPQSFWVTEIKPASEPEGGMLIRGNLRGDQSQVFENVCKAVQQVFGDKYTVFLIDDPEAEPMEGQEPAAKPAFQITLTTNATPKPTAGWQIIAALLLMGFTVATSVQVGLVANLAKLPKETLEWLARPENLNATDVLPPGLESWDPLPYIATAIPITLGVFGVQVVHELGHRITAGLRKIKLGPSYFVPNGQIGSFGATTPLKSVVRNRTDLFDLAMSGLVAGGGASLALFITGLLYTQGGEIPKELLVPVPSQLFQGSLLLGFLTKLGLGEETLRTATVYVHPYLIAGWCGLVGTALNSLPVGCIDGGRMMQAAYGRGPVALSSFFTYIGLALGFLGSSLSLPFGLYVLICQRTSEKYIQDNLTPVSDSRQTAAAVLILTAILILLPMAPELADTVGVGPQSPFL